MSNKDTNIDTKAQQKQTLSFFKKSNSEFLVMLDQEVWWHWVAKGKAEITSEAEMGYVIWEEETKVGPRILRANLFPQAPYPDRLTWDCKSLRTCPTSRLGFISAGCPTSAED